jgi:hypothetical protein
MDKLSQDLLVKVFSNVKNIEKMLKMCSSSKEIRTMCEDPVILNIIKTDLITNITKFKSRLTSQITTATEYENYSGQMGSQLAELGSLAERYMDRVNELYLEVNKPIDLDSINRIAKNYLELKSHYQMAEDRIL